MSALPNFLVLGAQKCGTTSIHNYLSAHPDIFLPKQKETKYFVDEDEYSKGIDYYSNAYFSDWNGEKAIGEVDPDYLYFKNTYSRIVGDLGKPKLIFLFRNPIDRAFSHYLMTYRRNLEKLDFDDAISMEDKRISEGYYENFHYSYVNRGLYFSQVKRYLEYWDISDMHFVISEKLRSNPKEEIRKCLNFIDVNSDFVPSNINRVHHAATVPKSFKLMNLVQKDNVIKRAAKLLVPKLSWREAIRRKIFNWNQTESINLTISDNAIDRLAEIYKDENRKLSNLTNCDLSVWNI